MVCNIPVFPSFINNYKLCVTDESSSSSSSSSDESEYEDDSGSIDSKDFGFIKQDLNICPKGCEPALFNFTVELRSKRYTQTGLTSGKYYRKTGFRHEIEQNEREELRMLDLTKKEIDIVTRKLSILKKSYGESQDKLEAYRVSTRSNIHTCENGQRIFREKNSIN